MKENMIKNEGGKVPPYPHVRFRDKFTGVELPCYPGDHKIGRVEYWDELAREWKPLVPETTL